MNAFFNLLAPFALMLPAAVAVEEARGPFPVTEVAGEDGQLSVPTAAAGPVSDENLRDLIALFRPAGAQQVRIEERVTIRIAPRPSPLMPSMFAQEFTPQQGVPRFLERKMGKCVAMTAIMGVQPARGNRLILMLRDRRTVSATLPKSCQAQAYYSGFLVAKSNDGMICQGRDLLMARNGTNCTVTGFRQIVEQAD